MSQIDQKIEQIIRYLKGLLSNRERHILEKEMMRDMFDEEAFEGLSVLSGDEFQADMAGLSEKLKNRTEHRKRYGMASFYRIAAAVILLMGIGTVIVLLVKQPEPVLVTEDMKPEQQSPPAETALPSMPEQTPAVSESKEVTQPAEHTHDKSQSRAVVLNDQGIASDAPVKSEEKNAADKLSARESVMLSVQRPEDIGAVFSDTSSGQLYITGRIVGIDHEALTGASIMEKGNNQKETISDLNGNFKLRVKDLKSNLTVNHLGYEPVEIASAEAAAKDIALQEDRMALNEIVVLGYDGNGSKRKSARSGIHKEKPDTATAEHIEPYDISKPVPPGGSLKSFENWVEDRIDFEPFGDYPGDYNIHIKLIVNKDGSVSDISVDREIPYMIASEYKRVISKSTLWKPALDENTPVDAEVQITFVLIIR